MNTFCLEHAKKTQKTLFATSQNQKPEFCTSFSKSIRTNVPVAGPHVETMFPCAVRILSRKERQKMHVSLWRFGAMFARWGRTPLAPLPKEKCAFLNNRWEFSTEEKNEMVCNFLPFPRVYFQEKKALHQTRNFKNQSKNAPFLSLSLNHDFRVTAG